MQALRISQHLMAVCLVPTVSAGGARFTITAWQTVECTACYVECIHVMLLS